MNSNAKIEQEDRIDLVQCIIFIFNRRWLVVFGVALYVVFIFVNLAIKPDMYQAEVIFLPSEERDLLKLKNNFDEIDRESVYIDILQSSSLCKQVLVKKYEYQIDKEHYSSTLLDFFNCSNLQQGIEALLNASYFERSGNGVIKITVQTTSAELSALVANEFVNSLKAYNMETQQERMHEKLGFIETRMSELQNELAGAEENLVTFQNQNLFLTQSNGNSLLSPEMAAKYTNLKRSVETLSTLLMAVKTQYEAVRIEAKKDATNIEILNHATPPTNKVQIDRGRILGIGFIGSLLLMSFLALFLEYLKYLKKTDRLQPLYEGCRRDIQVLTQLIKFRFPKRN